MYAEKYLIEFNFNKLIIKQLDLFYLEFEKYNTKVNLSSNRTEDKFFINNVRDSIGILNFINFNSNTKLIDVGSGGGFPGVILAIIFPNIEITLLDSNIKKINWLKFIKEKLDLKNISIIYGRIEEQKNLQEKYDYALFKGFSKVSIILEIGAFLLKKNGALILYKGNNYLEEIQTINSKELLKYFDLKFENSFEWNLADNIIRYFLIYKKVNNHQANLPRKYNLIITKPLF